MSSINRGSTRNEHDFYETPEWVTKLILNEISPESITSFHEPCRGGSAIYNLIPDIMPKSYHEISEGKDYLTEADLPQVDLIVTNPPFSLAKEFLEKSLSHSKNVAYLLRLNFFGSQKRKPLWESIGTPPRLFILSKRPVFAWCCKTKKCSPRPMYPVGHIGECENCGKTVGPATDSIEYAWFCWGNDFKRDPGIYIL